MADTVLSYTIPDGKTAEYVSDYIYIHKNDEVDVNGDLIYGNAAWVREHILRGIKAQIVRGKNAKLKDALTALNVDDVV